MLWIERFFSIIREIRAPAFKIDSEDEEADTGLIVFWISIKGKYSPPICKDPIDLLKESRSNNCFSEEDFNWIIASALENQKRIIENKLKKKFSLIKHQFSGQLEEPLVVFKDYKNQIYIKPAKEMYYCLDNIKQFSSEDSACIGNIIGSYETEQEYKNKKVAKKTNVIRFDTSLLSG